MGLSYGWHAFRKDLVAGLTVAAIAVPQAMAYALIADVDPRFGLYSAIVVTALASILGSSSHLINGPTNAISLVVFSALAFLGTDARLSTFEAMFALAVIAGAMQIAVALFRLGDLTRYISDSVVLGFMAGAGALIALSQVAHVLGVKEVGSKHDQLIYRVYQTLTTSGPINYRALGISLGTILFVLVARRIVRKYRLPRVDMLLAVTITATLVAVMGWAELGENGKPIVPVVPPVPASLPAFHVPVVEWGWMKHLLGSSAAIAFLGLLEALAIAKSIAHRTREPLDYNRQCLAEGVANLAGGFFQCLPGSGSLTRSAINFQAGAVTRWSGVVAAVAVAIVVIVLAPLAKFIPRSALAGILMVTAAGLVDWPRLGFAMRASRFDAGLVLVTAFSAVFYSVEFAILIGVGLSVLLYIPRAAHLRASELIVGADRVVRGRREDDSYCTKLVIYDFEGELFFGAAWELDRYLDELRARSQAGARILVLRMKRTRNPDVVCMERLQIFIKEMQLSGVSVLICGVRADLAQAMSN
jgi:SulP family sulfate permease